MDALSNVFSSLNADLYRKQFLEQDELLVIPNLLPLDLVKSLMETEVEKLRPHVRRSYIPTHKKGGAVSFYDLKSMNSPFIDFYRHEAIRKFISDLTGSPVYLCNEDDAHSCVLYYYSEPGDHIGYHYDSSFYKGRRYTVLIGIQDDSSCDLLCDLYTRCKDRPVEKRRVKVSPGTFIIFNGDRLWHAVSPMGENEKRTILSLEYVSTTEISYIGKWLSAIKDCVTYFGISALLPAPNKEGVYEGTLGFLWQFIANLTAPARKTAIL